MVTRLRKAFAITGALLFLVLFISITYSDAPVFTASRMIPESFVSLLEQQPPVWAEDPIAVAIQLIRVGATDPMNNRGTTVRRFDSSDGTVLVTIDDHSVADDSTSRTYDVVRL